MIEDLSKNSLDEDNEKFDELLKNLSDEDKKHFEEVSQELIKVMIPGLFQALIVNGLIDRNKLDDENYAITVLRENYKKIRLPNLQVETYSELRKSLESEIKAGREEGAIILAGVCIEHLLNHFYQDLLPIKYEMSSEDIATALNSVNIADKIGWFFKITTNREISEPLRGKIININKIRNKAVHYKAIPENLYVDGSGSYNEIKRKLESLKLEQLIEVTYELENFLNKTLLDVDDSYRLAHELSSKYFF